MDDENVTYVCQWNDLCRLCLRTEQPLRNVFFDEPLLENVREVTNLCVDADDPLPPSVCQVCVDQVNSFVDFRRRCKATESWLRHEAFASATDHKDDVEIVEVVDVWNDGCSSEMSDGSVSQFNVDTVGGDKCLCEDCGERFETSAQLVAHNEAHSSDPAKCESCCKAISEEAVATDKPCEKCHQLNTIIDAKMKRSSSYTAVEGGGGYLCKRCQKVFKTLAGMLSHLRNYEKKLETGSLSYRCHFCDEAFATIQQVWIHMKTHSPGEKIKCRHCEKCFKSYLTLVRHENKHEGTFNYVCSYCGKAFVTQYGRDRHEMTHNAAKNVQCEKCTMTFYTRAEYNRHMRYHDNIRNFLCSFCGKRFFESAHKTIHERTHTGERPFACNLCGKKFMSKQKARRHQAIHSRLKTINKVCIIEYNIDILKYSILMLTENRNINVCKTDLENLLHELCCY